MPDPNGDFPISRVDRFVKENRKNIAASVHARLLTGAHERKEDFNRTLQRYVAERFLYRLGESRYRERFVLKGAMLFALWGGSLYRATRDVDLTGYTEGNIGKLVSIIQEICAVPGPEDGLVFLPESVGAEAIRDQTEYHGFRVKLQVLLDAARINLQVDIGLGDVIQPPPQEVEYPVLLDCPAPRVRAYPPEAVVAEKFHIMVLHGERNSRFKDFYDVYRLAKQFPFEGPPLASAVAATFGQRRTPIMAVQSTAVSTAFYSDNVRAAQWRTYLDRNGLPGAPTDFAAVGQTLTTFLNPVMDALASGQDFTSRWEAGGPWKVRS